MTLMALETMFLTKFGLPKSSVFCATNGLQGYQKAINQFFDIIIMDLNMPVMDGFETAQKIRQYYLESQMYF